MRTVIADGPTLWEVDGITLHPIRYEARLTDEERARERVYLAFCAAIATLDLHLRWRGEAVEATA